MTAFGRLWSRAPLWRAALLLGLVTSVLAVLYPWPGGQAQLASAHYNPPSAPVPPALSVPAASSPSLAVSAPAPDPIPPVQPSQPATHAIQPPQPIPLAAGVKPDGPAFGSTVSGVVPFAGAIVPLPAGDWVTVSALSGRLPNGKAGNTVTLAQWAKDRLTGILFLSGFGAATEVGTGFPRVPSCQESRNVFSRVFIDRDGGEQACWSVDAVAIPWDDVKSPWRARGATELGQRGISLPEVVARTRFVRADKFRLLVIDLFQPVDVPLEGLGAWDWSHIMASPERLARMTRLRDWAGSWWPLIERGFTGHLEPTDVTPSVARLPF